MQITLSGYVLSLLMGVVSCVQAAAMRDVLIDIVVDRTKKANRHIDDKAFWINLRGDLHNYADENWSFHQGHHFGKKGNVDGYWDDLDDPLADFLSSQKLNLDQKQIGRIFKRLFSESEPCDYCGELFTDVVTLINCSHQFCDLCLLKHYTTRCVCVLCLNFGADSTCAARLYPFQCTKCNVFMGSDILHMLKKHPMYLTLVYKAAGMRHKAERAIHDECE